MFTLLTCKGVNILDIRYYTGRSGNLMLYVFYSWNSKLIESLA